MGNFSSYGSGNPNQRDTKPRDGGGENPEGGESYEGEYLIARGYIEYCEIIGPSYRSTEVGDNGEIGMILIIWTDFPYRGPGGTGVRGKGRGSGGNGVRRK